MTGHTGLRQAENAGELRDIEPLMSQHPEEPKARFVAEKTVEAGRLLHINESTFIDVVFASGPKRDTKPSNFNVL